MLNRLLAVFGCSLMILATIGKCDEELSSDDNDIVERSAWEAILDKFSTVFSKCQACVADMNFKAQLVTAQGNKGTTFRDGLWMTFLRFYKSGAHGAEIDPEELQSMMYNHELKSKVLLSYKKTFTEAKSCLTHDICKEDQLKKHLADINSPQRFDPGPEADQAEKEQSANHVGPRHKRNAFTNTTKQIFGKISKGAKVVGKIAGNVLCKTCRTAMLALLKIYFSYDNFFLAQLDDFCDLLHFDLGFVKMSNCRIAVKARQQEWSGSITVGVQKFFYYTPLTVCKWILICPSHLRYSANERVNVLGARLKNAIGQYGPTDPAIEKAIDHFEESLLKVSSNAELYELLQPRYVPSGNAEDNKDLAEFDALEDYLRSGDAINKLFEPEQYSKKLNSEL